MSFKDKQAKAEDGQVTFLGINDWLVKFAQSLVKKAELPGSLLA